MASKNQGFTLVELAIVIVIIGLLVGGVLQGQELIKQSQLMKITKSLQEYHVAGLLFKDKYKCTPGDCKNAQVFFGTTANGNPVNNGDGDQLVQAYSNESPGFWQHLSLAKTIKGSFSGVLSDINTGSGLPNAPVMSFNNAVFVPRSYNLWGIWNMNAIELGQTAAGIGYMANYPFISAYDAYSLDKKLDDGKANSGVFYCVNPNSSLLCSADYSGTPPGADYRLDLNSDKPVCTCVFYYDK